MTKKSSTHVRISRKLHIALKGAAQDAGETMTAILQRLVEAFLKEKTGVHPQHML